MVYSIQFTIFPFHFRMNDRHYRYAIGDDEIKLKSLDIHETCRAKHDIFLTLFA